MIREQFQQTEKLYHFTSFDTAKKIIESNCLRFGRLSNLNDIHENDKITFVDSKDQRIDEFPSDVLDALHDEIYKYRQISLTAEGENGDKDGFDLHQMWGLYAEKGEGVCLVFDKNELEKNPEMQDIKRGRVDYDDSEKLESFVITDSRNPNKVVEDVCSRLPEIFFHKREEWEHEQEYRLIKRCPLGTREEYLQLGHALKYVILSSKLQDVDKMRFDKRMKEIKEKVEKVEKGRNKGEDGKVPVLIYGNGLFEYILRTEDGEESIWNSNEGYNIINVIKIKTKITKEDILTMSNEELMDKTNDCAVDIHYNDGRLTQLCVNDLQSFDKESFTFSTRAGIQINLHEVSYVEVIEP